MRSPRHEALKELFTFNFDVPVDAEMSALRALILLASTRRPIVVDVITLSFPLLPFSGQGLECVDEMALYLFIVVVLALRREHELFLHAPRRRCHLGFNLAACAVAADLSTQIVQGIKHLFRLRAAPIHRILSHLDVGFCLGPANQLGLATGPPGERRND